MAQPMLKSHSLSSKAGQQIRARVSVAAGRDSISPISRKSARQQQRQQQQPQDGNNATSQRRPAPLQPSSRTGSAAVSYDILEAFFYGRAFAVTLSKRLSEVVVDTVAEISKAAAERPQRIQEFQEEVLALAQKEMGSAAAMPLRDASSQGSISANSSSAGSNKKSGMRQPQQDVGAIVDDLRAEIAYSRAILQQIKTGGKSAAIPGPPPPAIVTSPSTNNGSQS